MLDKESKMGSWRSGRHWSPFASTLSSIYTELVIEIRELHARVSVLYIDQQKICDWDEELTMIEN
jgi:hypothetical protein